MTYPTLPGHRFMYESDGTVVLLASNVVPTSSVVQSDAWKALINDMGGDGFNFNLPGSSGQYWITWVFPELRDLTALNIFEASGAHGAQVWTSTDTTTGTDGNWTLQTTFVRNRGAVMNPEARSGWQAVDFQDIKGLRIGGFTATGQTSGMTFYAAHLYGHKVTEQGLCFWHPTVDVKIPVDGFDYQDVPQGSVQTKQFRLKNLHGSETANGIILDAFDHEGFMSDLVFSNDGTTWLPNPNIGNLAPGAVTPVWQCRRIAASDLAIGVHQARVQALATSWS